MLEEDIVDAISVGSDVLLTGESGVGKTALIQSIGKRLNRKVFTIIGSLCDPTDINGFPVVDEYVIDAAGRKRKVIKFAPRDFLVEIVNELKGKAIVFFDELTSSPPSVQAALLRTVQTKQFGDFQLDPYKVAIVAACNPPDVAANGQEIPIPMANRLLHLKFPCDTVAAIEWTLNFTGYWGAPPKVGFDDEFLSHEVMIRARSTVAAFIKRFPNWWHYTMRTPKERETEDFAGGTVGFTTPRSWDRVSRHLGLCLSRNRPPISIARLVVGEVGAAAAVDFESFIRENEIPDPEDVLRSPSTYRPSGRVDVDYAVMTGVAAAVTANVSPERILAGFTVCNRICEARGTDGSPTYEAAYVAASQIGKLVGKKALKDLQKSFKMSAEAIAAFVQDVQALVKPFRGLRLNIFAAQEE